MDGYLNALFERGNFPVILNKFPVLWSMKAESNALNALLFCNLQCSEPTQERGNSL